MWAGVNVVGTNWVGTSGITTIFEMELAIVDLGACVEAVRLPEAVFDC